MSVYFIRHGLTSYNEKSIIQGRIDLDLSPNGVKQIKEIAKNNSIIKNIDIIFSSPLKRAIETSNILNKEIKKDIIIDKRIIERNFGLLEGKTWEYKDHLKKIQKDNFIKKNNIETDIEIKKRVYSFLNFLKEKYYNQNVLIVSHGGLNRTFHSYFDKNQSIDNFENLSIKNGEIIKYEF